VAATRRFDLRLEIGMGAVGLALPGDGGEVQLVRELTAQALDDAQRARPLLRHVTG
jgi:hypothetical protein